MPLPKSNHCLLNCNSSSITASTNFRLSICDLQESCANNNITSNFSQIKRKKFEENKATSSLNVHIAQSLYPVDGMNIFTILQSTVLKTPCLKLLKHVPQLYQAVLTQKLLFHGLANMKNTALQTSLPLGIQQLLQATNPVFVPAAGFKVKGHLKRRCKDCYFVVRQERLYVICKTHPRHKQMAMKKSEKSTWILTHATQSPIRPW